LIKLQLFAGNFYINIATPFSVQYTESVGSFILATVVALATVM